MFARRRRRPDEVGFVQLCARAARAARAAGRHISACRVRERSRQRDRSDAGRHYVTSAFWREERTK